MDGRPGVPGLHLAGAISLMAEGVGLESVLLSICEIATSMAATATGSAVSLVADDRSTTTVSDHPRVQAVAELQHQIHEGPALLAMQDGRAVLSESLASDPAWPRFGARAGRMGLHSVVVVPLTVSDRTIGTLSCYARAKAAFDGTALSALEDLAEPAAAIARSADMLARIRDRVDQLTEALEARPVIDQAIGIIRARTGKSENEALERLRRLSNERHVKVVEIAGEFVGEAVKRANASRRRARSSASR